MFRQVWGLTKKDHHLLTGACFYEFLLVLTRKNCVSGY